MFLHPVVDLVDQAAQVERHADLFAGVFVGTFWVVVVVVLGVVLLHVIKGRLDP